MRNVPPFSCPECGDSAYSSTSCARCRVPLVDVNGIPDLTVQSLSRDGGLLGIFRWRFRLNAMRRATRRGATKARALAQEAAVNGDPTRLEIRGRVRILEPVPDTRRGNVAIRKQSGGSRIEGVTHHYDARTRTHSEQFHAYGESVEHVTRCGRFVVENADSQALIDDDAIDVWVFDGCDVPAGAEWLLGALAGEEVVVVGPGERKVGVDWAIREQSTGYRESPSGFEFAGRPDDRVYVFVQYP